MSSADLSIKALQDLSHDEGPRPGPGPEGGGQPSAAHPLPKTPAWSQEPPPKKSAYANGGHVSTFKLLNGTNDDVNQSGTPRSPCSLGFRPVAPGNGCDIVVGKCYSIPHD